MSRLWQDARGAFALVAVVVGAGFASGREVLHFFTAFGRWSYLSCAIASACLAGLSAWSALLSRRLSAYTLTALSKKSLGGRLGSVAAWLQGALVVSTAGAMLAAMGEIMALALPVRGAYWIGVLASLAFGGWMAQRGLSVLAVIGSGLVPFCLLLYGLLLGVRVDGGAAAYETGSFFRAIPLAASYAAMNAALSCGVLCEMGRGRTLAQIIRAAAIAGSLLFCLLLVANAALSPHLGALSEEALPAVQLARSLGPPGYWLCLLTLMLAVVTTLIALLRTLGRMLEGPLPAPVGTALSLALPLGIALCGFEAIVGSVYPLLGAVCTLLFLLMIVKGGRR